MNSSFRHENRPALVAKDRSGARHATFIKSAKDSRRGGPFSLQAGIAYRARGTASPPRLPAPF